MAYHGWRSGQKGGLNKVGYSTHTSQTEFDMNTSGWIGQFGLGWVDASQHQSRITALSKSQKISIIPIHSHVLQVEQHSKEMMLWEKRFRHFCHHLMKQWPLVSDRMFCCFIVPGCNWNITRCAIATRAAIVTVFASDGRWADGSTFGAS